jgi:hypothetical protein
VSAIQVLQQYIDDFRTKKPPKNQLIEVSMISKQNHYNFCFSQNEIPVLGNIDECFRRRKNRWKYLLKQLKSRNKTKQALQWQFHKKKKKGSQITNTLKQL